MSPNLEYDVLIIGGGPAGMAAAIWCADLGLSAAIIEMESRLGGQLHRIYNPISNYPGILCQSGSELHEKFHDHLLMCTSIDRIEAEAVKVRQDPLRLVTSDGLELKCKALVIATGVEKRRLGIPGETEFQGKGVMSSGAKERREIAGKRVAIVGGGDAALENALILSDLAEHVYVIHRGEQFSARTDFVSQASGRPNVDFLTSRRVLSIGGHENVESIEIVSLKGEISKIDIDNILIRIGVTPNSSIFADLVSRNESGYILVDEECSTSVPGIYAVGDVTNQVAPTISGAVGQAATAIKSAFAKISHRS
ncbi:MAG: NAD(P)/FAD-dependent oxidoreductase [Pyrinomonadaceae bacterium]|nr:NAD(P)/FAD-dependent oxidoreductase [Pyrinomonadaceae bacterium]MBP6211737.1 NAD(P)/FAD-dependent oxidoreductase [Pyrinomonadaceae bacterium]